MRSHHTYSKLLSEVVYTVIRFATGRMAKSEGLAPEGTIITAHDLNSHRRPLRADLLAYWPIRLFSRLHALLPFSSGYMLIADAVTTKEAA